MGWGAGSPVLPGFPPATTCLPAPGWEPEPVPQQSLWGAQVSLEQVGHLCEEAPATVAPASATSSFLEASPPCLLSSDCASSPAWGPGTAEAPQGADVRRPGEDTGEITVSGSQAALTRQAAAPRQPPERHTCAEKGLVSFQGEVCACVCIRREQNGAPEEGRGLGMGV